MPICFCLSGGIIAALIAGRNAPGFVHNGPLAGLVAICAGSDIMHPVGALATGTVAGELFVVMFTVTQNRWKIDNVLGVWPRHGLCGAWGGIAAGIFGLKSMGGFGGVTFMAQLASTLLGIGVAIVGGLLVYVFSGRRSASAPNPRRSTRARTSASTRSAQHPTANPTGSALRAVPAAWVVVIASLLFRLEIAHGP